VIVSGLFDTPAPPAQVLDAWRARSFELVISPSILAEVRDVLSRPWLRTRLAWTDRRTDEFLRDIVGRAFVVEPVLRINVIQRDPDDNRVLEAAVAGNAADVVSGDKDLLSLGRYQRIEVVTPAAFVAVLAPRPG